MTAPAVPFAKADQMQLRSIAMQASAMPQPGRVIFWRGRKLLGYGDVAKLGDFMAIPKGADTVYIAAADYADVQEWMR